MITLSEEMTKYRSMLNESKECDHTSAWHKEGKDCSMCGAKSKIGSRNGAAEPDDLEESKQISEKWDTNYETPKSKKGMFKGRTKASLKKQLKGLKNNPNKTDALKTKEKEINFALRAKNKFGTAESYIPGPFSKNGSVAKKLAENKSEAGECDECGVDIDRGTLCAACKKKNTKDKSPKFKDKE